MYLFLNGELLTVVYPWSLRDVPVAANESLTYCGGAFHLAGCFLSMTPISP
jgi:hypothetical protein